MLRPDWMEKDPKEWPASAQIAYGILIRAATRRMEAKRGLDHVEPQPGPTRLTSD